MVTPDIPLCFCRFSLLWLPWWSLVPWAPSFFLPRSKQWPGSPWATAPLSSSAARASPWSSPSSFSRSPAVSGGWWSQPVHYLEFCLFVGLLDYFLVHSLQLESSWDKLQTQLTPSAFFGLSLFLYLGLSWTSLQDRCFSSFNINLWTLFFLRRAASIFLFLLSGVGWLGFAFLLVGPLIHVPFGNVPLQVSLMSVSLAQIYRIT